MRIRVSEEDPSKLVVYTKDTTAADLDEAAKIAKDISDGFSSLASLALDTNTREFPLGKLVDVVRMIGVLKGMNLRHRVPRELLGVLSSAIPPSVFFRSLCSEIDSEERALVAKKNLFSVFLQHLDGTQEQKAQAVYAPEKSF